MAAAVDSLNVANWQRGGGKGRRPRRIPRPGTDQRRTSVGHTDMPEGDVRAFLDHFRPEGGAPSPSS